MSPCIDIIVLNNLVVHFHPQLRRKVLSKSYIGIGVSKQGGVMADLTPLEQVSVKTPLG